jgi:hypothetical protein
MTRHTGELLALIRVAHSMEKLAVADFVEARIAIAASRGIDARIVVLRLEAGRRRPLGF